MHHLFKKKLNNSCNKKFSNYCRLQLTNGLMDEIEIIVVSNQPQYQGRVTLTVNVNDTIGDVLKAFCANLHIKQRSDFALCSRRGQLRKSVKISKCGFQPSEQLYLVIDGEH